MKKKTHSKKRNATSRKPRQASEDKPKTYGNKPPLEDPPVEKQPDRYEVNPR